MLLNYIFHLVLLRGARAIGMPAESVPVRQSLLQSSGLGYWIKAMDKGASLANVSQNFVDSDEFKTVYGATPVLPTVFTLRAAMHAVRSLDASPPFLDLGLRPDHPTTSASRPAQW